MMTVKSSYCLNGTFCFAKWMYSQGSICFPLAIAGLPAWPVSLSLSLQRHHMLFTRSTASAILALSLAVSTSAATATTYTNTDNTFPAGNIGTIGWDKEDIAQYFTAPGGTLQSFEFYVASGFAGNATFAILEWDGAWPVGPTLYSAPVSYLGGAQTLTFNNINLDLKANTSYLAALSGMATPPTAQNVTLLGSNNDAGLGGGVVTRYVYWRPWERANIPSLAFTADFASPVPEPGTWGMLLTGLGLIGWMGRRRPQAKKFS